MPSELKRLRKVYRGLVSSAAPSALSTSINSKTGSHEVNEASPASTPALPEDTTARIDNLMARVAVDYKKWWEIADVLINLADGAEAEEGINEDEQQREENTERERCKSEQTSSLTFPSEISRDLRAQEQDVIAGFQASKIALQAGEDPSEHRQEGMSISVHKSQSQAVSTPVQRKFPQLTRSLSASSLSPPSAHVSHTLIVTANLSTSTSISEDHCSNLEDHSNTLSERQLDILRGMLNPSVGLPSTPSNTSMTSRSADNSPARSPSITSISPRSQSYMHRLIPLTPFLSSTSSTSLSYSPVQRPHTSAGANITPSSSSTSSSMINLKRRNSTKKSGHIVIANLPPHSSRMDKVKAEEERGSSPIPDSPPFHISNMLPTPEHTMPYSPSSPSHIQQQRPAVSRSTSLSTSTKTFAVSSSSSGISSPPQTPLLRRGRFRAASRAGILGLRDFLKGFNSSGHGSSARKSTVEGRATAECVEDDAEAGITDKDMPERIEQTSISDSTLIKNQGHLNLSKQALCDSPPRISRRNAENDQNAANIGSQSSNSSSSSEEEDWDRHSSDEDMSKEAEGSLPRSDTQATIMPLSTKNQAILCHLKGGRELNSEPHQSQDEQNLQSTSDQYCNHSTSTLGTVVQYATVSVGQGDQASVYPMNQGEPRSAPIVAGASLESQDKNKVRLSISASASSNTRSDMKAKELVMTSEAMPVLLAKIIEVKEHCSTCVTELR